MRKGPIQRDYATILNIYAPNIESPKYIKKILTNTYREIDSNKTIVEDFNFPVTFKDRSSRQKIKFKSSEETLDLNFRSDGLTKHI